jgi:hypothetical protein
MQRLEDKLIRSTCLLSTGALANISTLACRIKKAIMFLNKESETSQKANAKIKTQPGW